jgi:hypothetical protein
VKITVPKTTVRNGEKLYIATAIVNTSTTEQMLVVMSCPEWTSDSTVVRVDAPSCMKNVPRKVPLKPGEEFTSVVHTHFEIPNGKSNTEKVTFRLGYRMPTFFGNEANPKVQPLWSNAVSISVTQ